MAHLRIDGQVGISDDFPAPDAFGVELFQPVSGGLRADDILDPAEDLFLVSEPGSFIPHQGMQRIDPEDLFQHFRLQI